MRLCGVEDCGRKHRARGLCVHHYNLAHYAANQERGRARAREWSKNNGERRTAYMAAWRKRNAARVKQYNADYYADDVEWQRARAKKRYHANPDKAKAQHKRWVAENRAHFYTLLAKRRARKAGAEGTHTASEVSALFAKQRGKCAGCSCKLPKSFHKDHVVPLSRGGSNWISNIQLMCGSCNSSKRDKDNAIFMREMGRLI